MSEKYNGWTNYETWVVNLHLTNTADSVAEWEAEAHAALEVCAEDLEATSDVPYGPDRVVDHAVHLIARDLKTTFCGDNVPELPGFYADLLNGALSDVNWHEIAKHFVDLAQEESNANG